jgi:hypothetical protein
MTAAPAPARRRNPRDPCPGPHAAGCLECADGGGVIRQLTRRAGEDDPEGRRDNEERRPCHPAAEREQDNTRDEGDDRQTEQQSGRRHAEHLTLDSLVRDRLGWRQRAAAVGAEARIGGRGRTARRAAQRGRLGLHGDRLPEQVRV